MSGSARLRHGLGDIDPQFAADVVAGLSAKEKHLPCRWFYDARGSELFERITELPEYYPTRTETKIFETIAPAIAELGLTGGALVEFGSGSSRKTEILLDALPGLSVYAPIDVSSSILAEARRRLERRYPTLLVTPILSDFTQEVKLSADIVAGPRLGFFPGSTIGNFSPPAAVSLLAKISRTLGPGAKLLVGVDLRKSAEILVPAYDDALGVTACFNLNLLVRINAELGGDFDLSGFAHEAVWHEEASRIEMRLVSLRDQTARAAGYAFTFRDGERIHTENSYKHTILGFQKLAADAGWRAMKSWTDRANLFSVHELEAP